MQLELIFNMDQFIEIIKAIVFGIVEGITEWLPVSSTGHMIVLGQFFGFEKTQGKAFYDFFLVIVQLGAIMAVIFSFFKELWPFGKNKSAKAKHQIWLTWGKILVASIPAGVIGLAFNDLLDKYLYNYLTVSITLIVYGVIFIIIELLLRLKAKNIQKRYNLNVAARTYTGGDGDIEEEKGVVYPLFRIKSVKEISIQYAFIIGLAQCLALIPGTSRSGVTICAALLLSINRTTATKFSFYLSIPAMLGGSAIKAIMYGYHVAKGEADPITWFQVALIAIAMVVAFGVSWLTIKYFLRLLRTRTFMGFGIYRIVLGIILLIIFYVVNKGSLEISAMNDIIVGNFNFLSYCRKPSILFQKPAFLELGA